MNQTSAFISSLQQSLGAYMPVVLGAIAILAVGWLAAVFVRAALQRGLAALNLNLRASGALGHRIDLEKGISLTAFWAILLVTFFLLLNLFNMQGTSNPFGIIVTQIVGYMPQLLAGIILIAIALVIGTLIKITVNRVLAATNLDEKLSQSAGITPMSQYVGSVLFWLVILLFVPAILSALQLRGLLEPMQGMLNKTLDMLPNIFAAGVIAVVGWFIARILSVLTTNLLAAAGLDQIKEEAGIEHSVKLSKLAGTLVFTFVFIPSLIAALDTLKIDAISKPATLMLSEVLAAIPQILAAAVILLLAYYLSRFAAGLIQRLIENLGLDSMPAKLGLSGAFRDKTRPSRLAATLFMFFAMLFAIAEAASQLNFLSINELVTSFIRFGGDILLGSSILVIGVWLSNAVYAAIKDSAGALAGIARAAILGLVVAMGLRAMGIADDIVNLAFGLTLGSVAVAAALAFGLGGREAAGRQLEYWLSKLRKD